MSRLVAAAMALLPFLSTSPVAAGASGRVTIDPREAEAVLALLDARQAAAEITDDHPRTEP